MICFSLKISGNFLANFLLSLKPFCSFLTTYNLPSSLERVSVSSVCFPPKSSLTINILTLPRLRESVSGAAFQKKTFWKQTSKRKTHLLCLLFVAKSRGPTVFSSLLAKPTTAPSFKSNSPEGSRLWLPIVN